MTIDVLLVSRHHRVRCHQANISQLRLQTVRFTIEGLVGRELADFAFYALQRKDRIRFGHASNLFQALLTDALCLKLSQHLHHFIV